VVARAFAEIAFTDGVREIQRQQGSADGYAKFLAADTAGGDALSEREIAFIAARDGFYQASVSETGWPYVQFRGGPAGFLRVLDAKTIAYADFRGNRQYVSAGNLTHDDRVSLIVMDYPNRARLKIWGRVKLVDIADDPMLVASLQMEGYRGRPERAVVITIEAVDWNCPQHIPQRLTVEEFEPVIAPLRDEIERLAQENRELRVQLPEED
jgi:predicted pyridoxine 5'-phosphate oxidase superfamily flavin-nucleotide-binding protein